MDVSDSNFGLYPEVPKMTDSELSMKLREMNFNIGPVNNFTRAVYARKLERVLLEQTNLEHILTPAKRPGNTDLKKDSTGMIYIDEKDVIACKGNIQAADVKGDSAYCTPSQDMTTPSRKEKFGSMKTIKASDNVAKPLPKEVDDVNAPPKGPQDKRKLPSTGHSESSGVFSSATAVGQAPKSVLGLQNDASRVRQRSVASNSDDVRNAKSHETCARREFEPEDLLPSARRPLSSYLQRVSASPPSRSDDLAAPSSPLPSAPVSKTQNSPETVPWLSWVVAVIVLIAVLLMLFLVFLNMEAGYNSPI